MFDGDCKYSTYLSHGPKNIYFKVPALVKTRSQISVGAVVSRYIECSHMTDLIQTKVSFFS